MQFHEMYMDKIHNHEVAGSIPAPATKEGSLLGCLLSVFYYFVSSLVVMVLKLGLLVFSVIFDDDFPLRRITIAEPL